MKKKMRKKARKNKTHEIGIVNHYTIRKIMQLAHTSSRPLMFFVRPGDGHTMAIEESAKDIATRQGMKFKICSSFKEWNKKKFCYTSIDAEQIDDAKITNLLTPNRNSGIIVIRNFTLAEMKQQNKIFRFIYERESVRLSGLSDNVQFILTGNMQEDTACIHHLPRFLLNRIASFDVRNDYMEWNEYVLYVLGTYKFNSESITEYITKVTAFAKNNKNHKLIRLLQSDTDNSINPMIRHEILRG